MLPRGTTVRRATLEDMEALQGLWRECRLPSHELEPRFTEFQLVLDPQGWVLACLGFRATASHGHVHNFGCRRSDLEADLWALLWDRILVLAQQTHCLRLWTREHGAGWRDRGFQPATPSELRELPAALAEGRGDWQTLKLREDPVKLLAAGEQLETYLEMERLRTDRMLRRGRFVKLIATAVAGAILLLLLTAMTLLLRRTRPGNQPRR